MSCEPHSILDELAAVAADVEQFLTDVMVVLSRVQTPDGMGGQVETWVASSTYPNPIPVRVRQSRPSQPIIVAGETRDSTNDFAVDYPTDVALVEKDRVQVSGTVNATFEVQAIIDTASWSILNTAWCIRKEYA